MRAQYGESSQAKPILSRISKARCREYLFAFFVVWDVHLLDHPTRATRAQLLVDVRRGCAREQHSDRRGVCARPKREEKGFDDVHHEEVMVDVFLALENGACVV